MAETVRQEHDRQGRVPADRGDRGAAACTCSPTCGTRPSDEHRDRHLDDRLERGGDARRHGAEVEAGAQRRAAAGKPTDQPNLVMGINVQVVWEKFCRYWDVEPRDVPDRGRPPAAQRRRGAEALSTRTPSASSPILGVDLHGCVRAGQGDRGGARRAAGRTGGSTSRSTSTARRGGFLAPFLDPDLVWDFRLPRVQLDQLLRATSTGSSTRASAGWSGATPDDLPDDLVFHVNYLGGDMPTFALNFSRPGGQIVAQYYNFLRLGREGYREVQQACRDTALLPLRSRSRGLGPFELMSDGSQLPVFFFRLRPEVTNYTVFDVSAKMRERGWQVPAYTLPRTSPTWPGSASSCATASTTTSPTCSSTTWPSDRVPGGLRSAPAGPEAHRILPALRRSHLCGPAGGADAPGVLDVAGHARTGSRRVNGRGRGARPPANESYVGPSPRSRPSWWINSAPGPTGSILGERPRPFRSIVVVRRRTVERRGPTAPDEKG